MYNKFAQSIPNLLTVTNLIMGILSILLMVGEVSANTRRAACAMILIGVIADALDGKMARCLDAESEIGKQLDSFADCITFGLAPMVVLYSFEELQGSLILMLAFVVYPMAGVFRLARFNLGDFKDFFLGLPITAAGAISALYTLFLSFTVHFYGSELAPFTALILFILAGFMISTLRIPRIEIILRRKFMSATE